jgi:hypothetical protein
MKGKKKFFSNRLLDKKGIEIVKKGDYEKALRCTFLYSDCIRYWRCCDLLKAGLSNQPKPFIAFFGAGFFAEI